MRAACIDNDIAAPELRVLLDAMTAARELFAGVLAHQRRMAAVALPRFKSSQR